MPTKKVSEKKMTVSTFRNNIIVWWKWLFFTWWYDLIGLGIVWSMVHLAVKAIPLDVTYLEYALMVGLCFIPVHLFMKLCLKDLSSEFIDIQESSILQTAKTQEYIKLDYVKMLQRQHEFDIRLDRLERIVRLQSEVALGKQYNSKKNITGEN